MASLSTIGSDLIAKQRCNQGVILALRPILRGFWLDGLRKRLLLYNYHHNVFFYLNNVSLLIIYFGFQ
jgi:hypothetical protein